MSKETGGPAFAASGHPEQQYVQQEGMTLRDYLAAKAMQGIICNPSMIDDAANSSLDWAAAKSYAMADAMLAARAISKATGE